MFNLFLEKQGGDEEKLDTLKVKPEIGKAVSDYLKTKIIFKNIQTLGR